MLLKNTIGFGLVLWILMFVIVSVFIAFKLYSSAGPLSMQIVIAIIGGIVSLVLAGYAKPKTALAAFGYGVSWTIVGLILDLLITVRFSPTVFSSWTMWLGYALVVLAPLLRVKKV